MRSRYRHSINPWPFAIVNKKGNPRLNVTFWVVIYSDSEFVAWVWTQLSYFEYKSAPPPKNICTCNFQVGLNERYMGILQKKKKNPSGSWRSLYVNDNVECLGSWIFSDIGWLSTFHCLLVECYHMVLFCEWNSWIFNQFILGSDKFCICTKEILLDRQKVGIMPTGYRTEKWVLYMFVYRLKNKK